MVVNVSVFVLGWLNSHRVPKVKKNKTDFMEEFICNVKIEFPVWSYTQAAYSFYFLLLLARYLVLHNALQNAACPNTQQLFIHAALNML